MTVVNYITVRLVVRSIFSMKIQELEQLAKDKKLILTKRKWRVVKRSKGWRGRKWDDQTNPNWDITQIEYQMYSYLAQEKGMAENQWYKITKKDYEYLKSL